MSPDVRQFLAGVLKMSKIENSATIDRSSDLQPDPLHMPLRVGALQALTGVLELGMQAVGNIDLDSPLGRWYGEDGIMAMRLVALEVIAAANQNRDRFLALPGVGEKNPLRQTPKSEKVGKSD